MPSHRSRSLSNTKRTPTSRDIESLLEKYHHVHAEVKELTEELEEYKSQIKKFMKKEKKKKIITADYTANLREQEREFVPNLPDELWDKYKKVTQFTVLTVGRRK